MQELFATADMLLMGAILMLRRYFRWRAASTTAGAQSDVKDDDIDISTQC